MCSICYVFTCKQIRGYVYTRINTKIPIGEEDRYGLCLVRLYSLWFKKLGYTIPPLKKGINLGDMVFK